MDRTAFFTNNPEDDRYRRGFRRGDWCHSIAVRDFIVRNISPYAGDETFLVGPSKRTKAAWKRLQPYFQEEQKKGVLAVDAKMICLETDDHLVLAVNISREQRRSAHAKSWQSKCAL